jgi:tryptophanyl-tRNA synthetase
MRAPCRFSVNYKYCRQFRSLLPLRAFSTPFLSREVHSSHREPADRVIFSGIQPTGVPHLGNYLGALQQWVRLQDTAAPGTKLLFSVVDLHAITVRQEPERLKQWKRETLATLLSVGLDPERSILFYQSSVSFHNREIRVVC